MKVEFLTPLRLEAVNGSGWVVYEHFVYAIDGQIDFVPAGTETDLDSVPRLPLAYWLVKGRARKSAVLHDWLYTIQKPRGWADEAIYAGMQAEMPRPKSLLKQAWHELLRKTVWFGVRVGGWHAYGKKDQPLEEVPPP